MADESKREENKYACISFLKTHGYWNPLINTVKFLLHFIVVMVLLFCGAMVFARFEDPLENDHQVENNTKNIINTSVDSKGGNVSAYMNTSLFWTNMMVKYNININEQFQEELMQDIKRFVLRVENREKTINYEKQVHNRRFIFMKWFYFVIIATTTIGYGDVYPRTNNGKLFYIFFSILGIVLMMTLLKSCGSILTAANKRFYALINRYLFRNKKFISEQLMSVISIIFIFFCFMLLVVWHDTSIREVKWSLTDTVYFWIVTFTTVGFGDVAYPLNVEVEHVYELLVYRVFGLSFLAGIIDSIQMYLKYRNVLLKRETRKFSKLKDKLITKTLAGMTEAIPLSFGMTKNFLSTKNGGGVRLDE